MRKILVILFLLFAVPAWGQPVNEWTIERTGYTVKGDGIAYEDGTWQETDPTIIDGGTEWSMSKGPVTWTLDKSDKMLFIHRGGKSLGVRPKAIYYVDRPTWDFTKIADVQAPSNVVEAADSITFEDIFPNVDAVLESKPSGPIMKYVFKSKAGYPATPYAPTDTWVVVGHDLDVTNAPNIFKADGTTAVDWSGTDTSKLHFKALKDYAFFPTVAVSSSPEDDDGSNRANIRQFLVEKGGTKYYTEAVKYSWFAAQTFPVTFEGYTTKSGTISSNESWDGVYVVTADTTINSGVTVDVAAGSVVKFDANGGTSLIFTISAGGTFDVNGTSDSLVYFDDCRNTVFDDTTSAECSGSPTPGSGVFYFIQGATATVTIDYAEFWYWGNNESYSSAKSLFTGSGWTSAGLDISDCYFHYSGEVTQRFINTADAGGPLSINIEDSVIEIHDQSATGPTAGIMYIDINANASSTASIKNVLIYGNGSTNVFGGRSADITKWTADYITWVDYDGTSSIDIMGVGNSGGTITNSIIYDAANVENTAAQAASTIGCFGVATTTECDWTDDPNFAAGAHDYIFSYNSEIKDFHLNSSTSPYFDDADETASAAGLDALHTRDDATVDSGTADLGFHFPVGVAAGIGDAKKQLISRLQEAGITVGMAGR